MTVTTCGRICYKRKKINLSQVFAGQTVGIQQVEDHNGSPASCSMIWDISMTRHADWNHCKTRSGRKRYLCLRNKL